MKLRIFISLIAGSLTMCHALLDFDPVVVDSLAGTYFVHGVKTPRLSPAPEISSDRYEGTLSVINYHPLRPVAPIKPSRKPNRKPPRKPPPPPSHLVAESLVPPVQDVTTSLPELKPIPPLPPPIPPLSSQIHDIKEGGNEPSLPPPRPHSAPVTIVRYVRQEDGIGNYYFGFESGDATVRQERGFLKNGIAIKEGYYKFLSPEGLPHLVDYIADEHGYRPTVYY